MVTIGIPAFNAAATIERALCSAAAQTWRPIEILIVDDCSTDGTQEILSAQQTRNRAIRLYRNAINQGVGVSRNRILSEARGEFVIFFDDDDASDPDRVVAQLTRILDYESRFANGSPVVCHTARRVIYEDGSQKIALTMGQDEGRPAPSGLPVAERVLLGKRLKNGYGSCATCSQMARRSTYQLVNGFDPLLRRCEDTDLNIRLALAGAHFVGIGRPLVTQYMTKTSEKSLAEEYRNILYLMRKHREFMEQRGQYEFCQKWIYAKQAWLESRHARFARSALSLLLSHPGLTSRRLALAAPNIGLNRSFRSHMGDRT
jgi:glycosyltransferase involved in cell wall biosynthesis